VGSAVTPDFWRRPIPRSLLPSAVALTAANLVPLADVLWLGWSVFALLLLFWLENVVIGVFNALRMVAARPDELGGWFAKLFMVPFFCVHYGIFTAVHGMFVIGFFGQGAWHGGITSVGGLTAFLSREGLLIPLAGLALSHAFSFAWNYIGQGEYRTARIDRLMAAPYGRVVVMHVTILGGGFLIMALGSPVAALILLLILKIGLDIGAHVKEHGTGRVAYSVQRAA
jgi:hypothetical protein